jgi:pilus assembly protein Flp/PilA
MCRTNFRIGARDLAARRGAACGPIAANPTTVPRVAPISRTAAYRRGTRVAFSPIVTRSQRNIATEIRTRDCARQFTRWRNNMKFINGLKKFALADEGQDLLEYALLVALIALVSVGVIGTAGTNVKAIFTSIGTALAPAA